MQKAKSKAIECHILQKFEKPQVFFLLNDLREPQLGERIALIEVINKEPNSAVAWNNILNHVKTHNRKSSEASGRDRLFRRAQSLIPETCLDKEYLSVWLNYIEEQQQTTGTAERVRSVFEYMNNRKIGTSFRIFYEKWSEFESSLGNSEVAASILQKNKTTSVEKSSSKISSTKPMNNKPTIDTKSIASTSIQPPAARSSKKVEELPDYIKNFDFKKLQQDKKRANVFISSSSTSSTSSTTSSSSTSENSNSTNSSSNNNPVVKTAGSNQIKRTLRRSGKSSSGPVRVLISNNNEETDDKNTRETDENASEEAEMKRLKVEEEDLELLSPLRPTLFNKLDSTPLEPVRESSFDSNASSHHHGGDSSRTSLETSRESNRRDSTSSLKEQDSISSLSSGGDKSLGSIQGSEMGDNGDDPTLPLDNSMINASQQLHDDDTAVVLKHHHQSQYQGKSTPANSSLSKQNSNNDDETDVIFKYKSTPISAISSQRRHEQVRSTHSSSITFEAGNQNGSYQNDNQHHQQKNKSYHKPVMRKLNDNLDDASSCDENDDDVDTDEVNHNNHHHSHHHRNKQQQQQSQPRQTQLERNNTGGSQDSFSGMFNENKIVQVNSKKYYKIGTLGKGGSSKVYRVLAEESGGIYALKRIHVNSDDPKFLKSFINEIQLMETLKNKPCIVQLISSEIVGRTIHMVMEPGETDLHGVLQRHQAQGSLSANFVRLAWQEMLTAVQVIHEHRIVHSDLKPANFLFVQGHLKLIDFGIAKQIKCDTVNITRDVQVGTLNYMSPEAIKDSGGSNEVGKPRMKLSRASDIWSLGCILYQMVYGKTPFAHITSFVPKMMAIVDDKHNIPFQKLKDKSVEAAIRSCLQRDPSKRAPISGPNGLLKQRFLDPSQGGGSSSESNSNGKSNVISASVVEQIVSRTMEESAKSPSASSKEIAALVIERLRREPLESSPPSEVTQTSSSASSVSSSASAYSRPHNAANVLKDLGSVPLKKASSNNNCRPTDKENKPAASINQGGDLKDAITKQLGKLRSASDSVAHKYQKAKNDGSGSQGIFSAMQESNLLLKTGIDKRRQDIMPSEDTLNTQCWGNEESWQS